MFDVIRGPASYLLFSWNKNLYLTELAGELKISSFETDLLNVTWDIAYCNFELRIRANFSYKRHININFVNLLQIIFVITSSR